MGTKDIVLHRYFQDDERFADLINVHIFQGKPFVSKEDIFEKDTKLTGIFKRLRYRKKAEKYRDAIRRVALGTQFVLIGLEHQNLIHYAMPVRVMLEDALNYDQQVKKLQKSHRRYKDLKDDEFLSGFSKDDRLEPVVTIVLYYGTEPWNGATDLTELLNNEQIPTELQPFINHYPLHILQVRDYENAEKFQTDLKEVFLFLKYSENISALKELTTKYQEQYSSMDEDAYDVITTLTNSKELETLKETNTEGGKVNMCSGLKGLIDEAVAEGIAEGIAERMAECKAEYSTSKAKTIAHNMFLRGMSQEDTAEICEENPELVKSWFNEWKS